MWTWIIFDILVMLCILVIVYFFGYLSFNDCINNVKELRVRCIFIIEILSEISIVNFFK